MIEFTSHQKNNIIFEVDGHFYSLIEHCGESWSKSWYILCADDGLGYLFSKEEYNQIVSEATHPVKRLRVLKHAVSKIEWSRDNEDIALTQKASENSQIITADAKMTGFYCRGLPYSKDPFGSVKKKDEDQKDSSKD